MIWLRSELRKTVADRCRVRRGVYRCEACKRTVAKIEVDHSIPVGRLPGSKFAGPGDTWDGAINRLLFADPATLRGLCRDCHLTLGKKPKAVDCPE